MIFPFFIAGSQEQSYIGNLMMYAACLGEYADAC